MWRLRKPRREESLQVTPCKEEAQHGVIAVLAAIQVWMETSEDYYAGNTLQDHQA